ncbi:neuronal acetylcholine receptor subunit alpha-6-like [Argopecten irradians]|uniref:neuronal acetylcholine receptor subunit alpha-6-like n=1 Tax=Argopecten irradians TaxID=31199 RepID=UPI00371B752F
MKIQEFAFLFFMLCFFDGGESISGTIEDLATLIDKLFLNYRREIRPARNLNETVRVNISFFLVSIADLDEVSGTITMSGGITMIWQDFRLSWQPSDHGGIDQIMINSSMIWQPLIFLLSFAAEVEKFSADGFDARIYNDGTVQISPGRRIAANCEIDMTNFPTDRQKCSLDLLSWGYPATEIHLSARRKRFQMDFFNPHGEWQMEETFAEEIPHNGTKSSQITYSCILKRKSPYFLITMIVPVFILCFLNPFVFLLPASSGERISYTITMFLSLAVYMTLIGDNMPKVSEPMAGISYFILISMVFSCVLIILTIFTLRCEAVADASMYPKCLRQFALKKNRNTSQNLDYVANGNADKAEFEPTKECTSNNIRTETGSGQTTENFIEEKTDIMKTIDISLFFLTETIVIVLILGFSSAYYK